jgi:hypothetical protein
MISLTFDEWERIYEPVRILDTHGKDWATVQTLDPRHVFTVRDADGHGIALTNGIGYVDRLEYWEVAVPWNDGDEITVQN